MDETRVELEQEKKIYEAPAVSQAAVTTDQILGALANGMSFEEIEKQFNIKRKDIISALSCTLKNVMEEVVCVSRKS